MIYYCFVFERFLNSTFLSESYQLQFNVALKIKISRAEFAI